MRRGWDFLKTRTPDPNRSVLTLTDHEAGMFSKLILTRTPDPIRLWGQTLVEYIYGLITEALTGF